MDEPRPVRKKSLSERTVVRRHRQAGDRRSVRITLTAAGRDLVAEAIRRRRAELTRLLAALPPGQHEPVIAAFRAFTAAAGELPQPGCRARLGRPVIYENALA